MSATIGSLFSGIAGLELGLERAGLGPVIWQAESEPFCRRVLAKHWPGVKCYEDVRDINGHTIECDLDWDCLCGAAERPDIICGGFPCQDISVAGKGAGLEGERSGLWYEYARIVRELRPRVVVVENVTALLGRGLGVVLGDLAALGYDAFWDCIPAAALGAPHRRDRIFVVSWRVSDADGGGSLGTIHGRERAEGVGEDEPARRVGGVLADALGNGPQGLEQAGAATGATVGGDYPAWPPAPDDLRAWRRVPADSQPAICRLADGAAPLLAGRAGKLRALGNAVVPQVAEHVGHIVRGML